MAEQRAAWAAARAGCSQRLDGMDDTAARAATLLPLLEAAAREVLAIQRR